MSKKKTLEKINLASVSDFPMMPMSLGTMHYNRTGSWRNIKPVIDLEQCIQCGICWKFCPDVSILIQKEYPVVDYVYCKGCGICAAECPTKCIAMVEEEK